MKPGGDLLPEARHHVSARILIAVTSLSFIVLLLAMPRDLNMYDEGIILSDAMRVQSGEFIHRDFYSPYGPGQYYAVAAVFRAMRDFG